MSEPVTYDTQDSDNIKIAEVFEDCVGKDYAHVKTGGVYTIREFVWDADSDQWAILYQRKDCKGMKFKRLLKNFFGLRKISHALLDLNMVIKSLFIECMILDVVEKIDEICETYSA